MGRDLLANGPSVSGLAMMEHISYWSSCDGSLRDRPAVADPNGPLFKRRGPRRRTSKREFIVNLPSAIVRRGIFHSLRFELVFVLALGIVMPLVALALIEGERLLGFEGARRWMTQASVVNSSVGMILCTVVLTTILRQLRLYPGVAVARSIVPVFGICFGLLMATIIGFRLEHHNTLLLVCCFCVLTSRFAITAMRSRSKGVMYCIVPGGRVDVISELPSAPVIIQQNPEFTDLPECAIVADLNADLNPEWERFLAEAAISGRPVYHYKQVWEAETGRVQIEHLSENGFGALVPSFAYQKMKRAVDLLICLLALPVIVSLMALCALAIKWDTDGPVLFRQRRMGFRGNAFHVLKLRTMTHGNNGEDRDLSITQSGDRRITRVGRFLRRTRLDELPQVFNILRGEMSWIGPRPEAVSLSRWYESEIPFYRYRHIVRPGITGWAQVNQGHVADLHEVDEKLQYDFYYIKNLSYWLDIVIVLRTARVILSGFGSK